MQKPQIEGPGQLRFHPDLKGPLDKFSLSLGGIRKGTMFGHPGYFLGRKLVACHFAEGLAAKVGARKSSELIRKGSGKPFQAYGRKMGPEWIFLPYLCNQDLPLFESVLKISLVQARKVTSKEG